MQVIASTAGRATEANTEAAIRVDAAAALASYALIGRLDRGTALVGVVRHLEVAGRLLQAGSGS
jgi:hypothetical protein